jgi:cytochrome c553
MANPRIVAAAMALGLLTAGLPAYAADSAAGKSDAELETELKGIVAGTTKHPKKLTLSDTEVANVAAYIASNEPK